MNKAILIILDGWGIGDKSKSDAIFHADTPNMDALMAKYPNSEILTCGEDVGLPVGQMGNSEVGHLNIGAGRVVFQDLVRINNEIKDNSISDNAQINKAYDYAKANNKRVHFVGLIGHGGVHAMQHHLYKLCDIAKEKGLADVFIHGLMDGRDTDPKDGLGFMTELVDYLKGTAGTIATMTGRYYSMDRDKRWDRVKIGYDALVSGIGKRSKDVLQALQESYDEGITDEFVKPVILTDDNNEPLAKIEEGDVVICFNYRTDRLRQMTTVLTQQDMPEEGMNTINLEYYTMTRYDETFKGINIIYNKIEIHNTMGEILKNKGLKQLRIAETEKYAHVTFFFNGGVEKEFDGEERILVSSPKVATYDLQPEMSAPPVKEKVVEALSSQKFDFVCLNFANGDMVGHTGDYESILKAINTVDSCVGEVVQTAKDNGYEALIIADHGNADNATNADGSVNTAHSLNPVPCILVSDRFESVENGVLADVAPTLLSMMDIEIPSDMTGKALVAKKEVSCGCCNC